MIENPKRLFNEEASSSVIKLSNLDKTDNDTDFDKICAESRYSYTNQTEKIYKNVLKDKCCEDISYLLYRFQNIVRRNTDCFKNSDLNASADFGSRIIDYSNDFFTKLPSLPDEFFYK